MKNSSTPLKESIFNPVYDTVTAYFSSADNNNTIYKVDTDLIDEKSTRLFADLYAFCNFTQANITDAMQFERIKTFVLGIKVPHDAVVLYREQGTSPQDDFEKSIEEIIENDIYNHDPYVLLVFLFLFLVASGALLAYGAHDYFYPPDNSDESDLSSDLDDQTHQPFVNMSDFIDSTDEDDDDDEDKDNSIETKTKKPRTKDDPVQAQVTISINRATPLHTFFGRKRAASEPTTVQESKILLSRR